MSWAIWVDGRGEELFQKEKIGRANAKEHSMFRDGSHWCLMGLEHEVVVLASFHSDKNSGLLAVIVKYSEVFQAYC